MKLETIVKKKPLSSTYEVVGMTCAACVGRVERALLKVPGISQAEVQLAANTVTVYGDDSTNWPLLADYVSRSGYELQKIREKTQAPTLLKAPLLVALLGSAPLLLPMLVSWIYFVPMPPPWVQFILGSIVQFYPGLRFYRGAWKALQARHSTMDTLVALGTSAAYFLSLYLWIFEGGHHLYFESAAVIIALVILGKSLEEKAKFAALSSLRALDTLRPDLVEVKESDGKWNPMPLASLVIGMHFRAAPGSRIATDGIVTNGASQLDSSFLTGESLPSQVQEGSEVAGGSLNLEGALEIVATAAPGESAIGKITRLVASAQAEKPAVQVLVDRISDFFVPTILVLSVATALIWLLLGATATDAIVHALSVLVIACPCALGLATPLVLVVSLGKAAEKGILYRRPAALEHGASVDFIAFDKTGTLTKGQPTVESVSVVGAHSESQMRAIASMIAAKSHHPYSRAIARSNHMDPSVDFQVREVAGSGVEAVATDGQQFFLGSLQGAQARGVEIQEAHRISELGQVVLADLSSKRPMGYFRFSDAIREESRSVISQLKESGYAMEIWSGDNQQTVDKVAAELGIKGIGQLSPEDKWKRVEARKIQGSKVALVGDGINDAPALASAHLAISMGHGTNAAEENSDVVLLTSNLKLLPLCLRWAKLTQKKIRQNLFFAFVFNLIGIPLAATGGLSPSLAGTAMALSSFLVVQNSLWLKRQMRG
jgi:P-type Cu+ transporter